MWNQPIRDAPLNDDLKAGDWIQLSVHVVVKANCFRKAQKTKNVVKNDQKKNGEGCIWKINQVELKNERFKYHENN